jgi:O-antigen ligase
VAIATAVILGPLLAPRAGFTRRFMLPLLIGGAGLAGAIMFVQSGLLGEQAQERLTALFSGQSDSLEGESRFMIWGLALQAFLQQPWGFGYGNTAFALANFAGIQLDIHSTYFSALVDGGAISFGTGSGRRRRSVPHPSNCG